MFIELVVTTNLDWTIRFQVIAAIDGLHSSPDEFTSAPNITVGKSLTKGILQLKGFEGTIFFIPSKENEQSNVKRNQMKENNIDCH